ncbi:unnamed protein product [Clonostachys rosea]|uniref:Gfo/Idh/MocA-like oxidoreductase N-terminal domain-containing protein n=1 Tax=Bionectria ochroleuca TaxID=29856 RepID=A0ABY6V3B8_BIOOC|nr:unnamed protein product [Clonostachys rosea]
MSVGVALIGAGIWAREEHLPAVEASKDLVLKAVYSRTLKSAQSISAAVNRKLDLYTEEGSEGYDAILKRDDIQAIIVSLSINSQPEYIRKALLAGKHVLSEKPVAENVKAADELIKWYRAEIKGATWCIAENWRFLASYEYGFQQIKSLGKVLSFSGRQLSSVLPTGKFYLTDWRKNPTHQGGFLLDGGVHYMAGIRKLLSAQPGSGIDQVSAFTVLHRDYLPPVDTANVVFKTKSGAVGTFQISVASSAQVNEWIVDCEKGWIKIEDSKVTIGKDGQIVEETIPNERTGVPPEVRAWGESLVAGKVLKEQEPEAALADLELMELILRSGDSDGQTLSCTHQNV